jgi:hypothetical protein
METFRVTEVSVPSSFALLNGKAAQVAVSAELHYILTYLLTPCSTVLLEKLTSLRS